MSMINPLARARGLGSAKGGTRHWYLQRASAVLLIVLAAWFLYAIVALSGASHAAATAFLARPPNAAAAVLFVVAMLYHAMLSIQVVIEDYIHAPALEWALQFLVRATGYAGMAVGVVYILKIALA